MDCTTETLTEKRILEVYAGEDVRQPNPNDPTDKGETIKGFYVTTYLEQDGEYVEDSGMPVGQYVELEVAIDAAVMAAKEGWCDLNGQTGQYDEVRFEGLEITSVRAKCHTDDYAFEYQFDAAPWFDQATAKEIVDLGNCGWGGDYPADVVAEFISLNDDRLTRMFHYAARAGVGFECHVDDGDAAQWLATNRPQLLAEIESAV